jgi:hypothetical protein
MQPRVRKNNVLVSVVGCVIVDGDQVVQELAWTFLQAQ